MDYYPNSENVRFKDHVLGHGHAMAMFAWTRDFALYFQSLYLCGPKYHHSDNVIVAETELR